MDSRPAGRAGPSARPVPRRALSSMSGCRSAG